MNCNTILIVEDDRDIRESLISLLELEGYDAHGAPDGKAALDTLPTLARPCLILLDLMMPVMDGWQFLALKDKDVSIAPIPVVVISALDPASRPAVNASGFMRKPLDFDLLLGFVKRYCA
mgnify:CR=1 FL=1